MHVRTCKHAPAYTHVRTCNHAPAGDMPLAYITMSSTHSLPHPPFIHSLTHSFVHYLVTLSPSRKSFIHISIVLSTVFIVSIVNHYVLCLFLTIPDYSPFFSHSLDHSFNTSI